MLPNVAALSLDHTNEEVMLWEKLPEDLKQAVAEQVLKTGNPDCMKPRILGKLFVANSEKLLISATVSEQKGPITNGCIGRGSRGRGPGARVDRSHPHVCAGGRTVSHRNDHISVP